MKKIFIGIDFSKEKFDATVIKAEGVEECAQRQHEVFDNKVSGFRRLLRWVKSVADEPDTGLWLFCGENTGGYSKALCNFLYGSGYDMWLENALSIKRSSALQRVKSDKADSGIIAEYAMRNYDQMRLYKPLGRNLERLREVFLYRHNLVKLKVCITLRKGEKQLTQEKSDISRFMAMSSKHLISEFNKKIAECDKRIQQIIDEDEDSLLLRSGSFRATVGHQREHTCTCESVCQQADQGPADTGCARIRQLLSADGYILPQASRGRKEETCCCQ